MSDTAFPPGYYSGDELPAGTAYITFDDGPADWTGDILDTLKRENVRATFFVCARWNYGVRQGDSFTKYRAVLARMRDEGHVIGNHTAGHRVLSRMPAHRIEQELVYNQDMLDRALGDKTVTMTIFRPPLGSPWLGKSTVAEKARVARIISGYSLVVLWTYRADSTDSWDWVEGEWYRECGRVDTGTVQFQAKKKRILERVLSCADGRGMVILCHDTHNTTAGVLPDIITGLKSRGYVFRTMEEYFVWKYGMDSREILEVMNLKTP